ncbi:hypothetical protein DYB32_001850 [Aphanomyces invadans]|uniref:Uncharacterized protein n=1 Tax=Aphanomyces invadans TaxID=157072 RepID=A0A3R6VFB2_9STRA|nr:hypothetical protein DYB32_001850 [Aphanomyces invadans]
MDDDFLAACLDELNHTDDSVEYDLPDEDIASLMEVLHSSDSGLDDTSLATSKKKRNRKRAAHEIIYLRDKVVEYTRQLRDLQNRLIPHTEESLLWHERSLRQASARRAAEDENQALKDMLQRQVQLAESLMKIVSKRPRVAEMTYLNKWKQSQTIGIDPIERRTTFHALLDAHYNRLESVFIAQRLYDSSSSERINKTEVAYDDHSREIVFDFTAKETANVDYLMFSNAIWDVYGSTYETPFEVSQPLERFGEDACMVKMVLKLKKYDLDVHQHMGCKRYLEHNRVVMVFDSILNDQAHPYPASVYVARETSWYLSNDCDTM